MMMMIRIISILTLSRVASISASYSLSYYSNEATKILNAGLHSFQETPTAQHIADIYTRISGLSPILREETTPLPILGVFSAKDKLPVILEVIGGALPTSTQSLIGKGLFHSSSTPKAESVAAVLKQNKIQTETFVINNEAGDGRQLSEWLQQQERPVFILHHEVSSSNNNGRRILSSNSTSSVLSAPLDERQISQYQICLWTGVVLVLLLLASVCGVAQMEVVPDSLLYAKFQSGRTGGKFD